MSEKIGALWVKQGKNGSDYFTGVITINNVEHRIVMFKNTYKEKDTQPDFNILMQDEKYQNNNNKETTYFGKETPDIKMVNGVMENPFEKIKNDINRKKDFENVYDGDDVPF